MSVNEREPALFSFFPLRTAIRIGSATVKWSVVCAGMVLSIVTAAGAFQLITEQEAALPDDLTGTAAAVRRAGRTLFSCRRNRRPACLNRR